MKTRIFPVCMDYRSTVEELISGENLDARCGNINSQNFPPIMPKERPIIPRERKERFLQYKKITLVNFDRAIGTDRVIDNLKQINLQPADIFDLLTLNRTYPISPGIKNKYSLDKISIIALGSLLAERDKEGSFLSPILDCRVCNRRYVHLGRTEYYDQYKKRVKKFDDWWPNGCWFAAVLFKM